MTKTHQPKIIIFCPINIEINFDGGQGIFFVNLETKSFDYEGTFCVKNPQTGKLEGKKEVREFSRLQFIYNSQKEVDNFSALVKKGQFYEVETSWSSDVKMGKIGGELKEVIWVKEDNPQIRKSLAWEEKYNDKKSGLNSTKKLGNEPKDYTFSERSAIILVIIFVPLSLFLVTKIKKSK